MNKEFITIDGNEAAAYIALRVNEVVALYPITPSSPMGESIDEWTSKGKTNIWGSVPLVQEMQSEAGAAGAVHGALQRGALTTTFTASQGLLLMIPNMYKIAGELTSMVIHVAARSIAAQALSIFGDHSDVMAVRQTGFALLCSASVQEATDFALIAQAATLESRVPFLHFFDGFRTSHEVNKIEKIHDNVIRQMIDDDLVIAHRRRGLTPDDPVIRGTAQNPDVYFQARETVNPYYNACPDIVQQQMDKFAQMTGRRYELFDYYGHPQAKRVIIMMGSGAETAQDTVDKMLEEGDKIGLLKVRLYRPFSIAHCLKALPKGVEAIAVLDRTKEPGSSGEPLYLDIVNAIHEGLQDGNLESRPKIIGGRYGLSSKEFTPGMVKGIYDELGKEKPKNHFTIGIQDDVTQTSLEYDPNFFIESPSGLRAIFYGLGSDGTVGANKNTIKIIGENTNNYAQAYFVYDSKKAGSITVSHLRFGPKAIHSSYLINRANFVGCHQFNFLERYDVLEKINVGGVFLLNAPYKVGEVWDHLPKNVQQTIIERKLQFYMINAYEVAQKSGMGGRINTIMQTCYFAISGILPKDEAIDLIKNSIQKAYGKKGEEIVRMNFAAVDQALSYLYRVKVPKEVTATKEAGFKLPASAPDFVKEVTAKMILRQGDSIPVSQLPIDGTYPVGTSKYEQRNIAQEIPVWDSSICIQCGKCVAVCPHSVIRSKVFGMNGNFDKAPDHFQVVPAKDKEFSGLQYTIQVAPHDCTGCAICVDVCPVKNKSETRLKAVNMAPQEPILEEAQANWKFFSKLDWADRKQVKQSTIRGVQYLEPLFEFSGACAACGETPYIKLMTQLFGDRALIANATGCSSIYGGNLPTTPWTKNAQGRGPAWSNSLFEDNAEFGLGFRLAVNQQMTFAKELLKSLEDKIGTKLVDQILTANQEDEAGIYEQRERIEELKKKVGKSRAADVKQLLSVVDSLAKKSIWIVGGDGWAYDIGFGGLDHVMASGEDVNILILDTEVYSNTGGQMSKATPRAAVAKFAAAGKKMPKKDMAKIAMTYENVYVANVAMGAKDEHTLKAFIEAERYKGPSVIIAYSHCVAHGINMKDGLKIQKEAVQAGYWPLFRYNPDLVDEGKNPFALDSGEPKIKFKDFAYKQNRFKMLTKTKPREAKELLTDAQRDISRRYSELKSMAKHFVEQSPDEPKEACNK